MWKGRGRTVCRLISFSSMGSGVATHPTTPHAAWLASPLDVCLRGPPMAASEAQVDGATPCMLDERPHASSSCPMLDRHPLPSPPPASPPKHVAYKADPHRALHQQASFLINPTQGRHPHPASLSVGTCTEKDSWDLNHKPWI